MNKTVTAVLAISAQSRISKLEALVAKLMAEIEK